MKTTPRELRNEEDSLSRLIAGRAGKSGEYLAQLNKKIERAERRIAALRARSVSAAYWRRRGEEAETEDHRAGLPSCVDESEIYSALGSYLDGDLPQDDPERTEAMGAAVEGYLAQAKGRPAEAGNEFKAVISALEADVLRRLS